MSGGRGSTHRHQRRRSIAQTASGTPGKKAAMPPVMRSAVAANVDPSVIIRHHVTVVVVPMVGLPDPRNGAMEVPRVNTAVTDPGETVIATETRCPNGQRQGRHGPPTDCRLRPGSPTARAGQAVARVLVTIARAPAKRTITLKSTASGPRSFGL
jgi:hypothetical protein